VHLQQHGMADRDTTDSFVSNAVVSNNLPKFNGGLGNNFAEFLSSEMMEFGQNNGFEQDQEYTAFSCNSHEHSGKVSLCASTNTLGRYYKI